MIAPDVTRGFSKLSRSEVFAFCWGGKRAVVVQFSRGWPYLDAARAPQGECFGGDFRHDLVVLAVAHRQR
jgi:hypothetical protein